MNTSPHLMVGACLFHPPTLASKKVVRTAVQVAVAPTWCSGSHGSTRTGRSPLTADLTQTPTTVKLFTAHPQVRPASKGTVSPWTSRTAQNQLPDCSPSVLDANHRSAIARLTDKPASSLSTKGVTADALTLAGLVTALATAAAIATGHFVLALVLLVLTGLADLLDGPVARHASMTSTRGAFMDSTIDRVADMAILLGFAWYLAGTSQPRLALLPMAIMALTSLISYQRAKAESLGMSAKGGLMERGERFVVLGLALLLHVWMVPILTIMLVLVSATALGRFIRIYAQTSPAPRRTPRQRARNQYHLRGTLRTSRAARSRRRALPAPSTRRLHRRSRTLSFTRRLRTPPPR